MTIREKYQRGPIQIDGVVYPSQAAAARALGVSQNAIWQRLHPDYRKQRRAQRPGPPRRRFVRVTREDMALAQRLLRHFPQVPNVEALFEYALRRLAETTDD